MIEGILIGLATALSFKNIFMVMIGCFFGTIIGMLPGLGPMTAIALMIPITYGFDPATGLILMAGVYYGAVFGGSTSSILLNAPGVPGTVATSFDGYPMAQQGKAGKALAIAAWSSFAGGTLSAIYLLFMAPSLSKVSLSFRSPDYFALMILGLTAIAAFSSKGQFLKAMMMVVLGLMLASVGQDSLSDITRFTFDNMNLTDGISFVLVVMSTFAMSEALTIILKRNDPTAAAKQVSLTELGSIKINKEERGKMYRTIPRSSVIGFLIGVLPGAGATIASFLAYGMERNFVKNEEKELVPEMETEVAEAEVEFIEPKDASQFQKANSNTAVAEQQVNEPLQDEIQINSDKLIAQKVEEVVAQVQVMEDAKQDVTDAEVDSLLRAAQRQILTDKLFADGGSVDAMSLLAEVEDELDESFRDQIFDALKSGYLKLRTAVADRNQ